MHCSKNINIISFNAYKSMYEEHIIIIISILLIKNRGIKESGDLLESTL